MEIWAHRGAFDSIHVHPALENTLPAFQLAADKNAYGVELDIQLTKDGTIVVIHDETVDRTCDGNGHVKDFTLAEIKKLNANKAGKFTEIPTLSEVFELLKHTPLKINVEFKTGIIPYEGIEEKALALAEKHGVLDKIVWSSFNHHSVQQIKMLDYRADTALLCGGGILVTALQCQNIGASALHANIRQLKSHPYIAGDCRKYKIALRLWTVDAPDDFARAIKNNVDGVFTNKIDVAVDMLKVKHQGVS